jgi:hypothetical protein
MIFKTLTTIYDRGRQARGAKDFVGIQVNEIIHIILFGDIKDFL